MFRVPFVFPLHNHSGFVYLELPLTKGELTMIIGAHSVIASKDPDKDRAFLRDVLKLPVVDAGGGYLIFGFPAAEASVHETNSEPTHELYLLCDDVEAFISDMERQGVSCSAVNDAGWGLITQITLPSGAGLHVYQPRHARPASAG
jgi:hypothetical protein